MEIETQGLIIRLIEVSDGDELYQCYNQQNNLTKEAFTQEFKLWCNTKEYYAVILKEQQKIIGYFHISNPGVVKGKNNRQLTLCFNKQYSLDTHILNIIKIALTLAFKPGINNVDIVYDEATSQYQEILSSISFDFMDESMTISSNNNQLLS